MAHRLTLVTIAVEAHSTITGWETTAAKALTVSTVIAWTVDGPAGTDHGIAPTEGEAWTDARSAAVKVMGRLEVPGGGDELRRALAGEAT